MEPRNPGLALACATCLVVGAVAGWVFARGAGEATGIPDGSHRMPDGSLMANDGGMAHDMAAMTARLEGKTGDELDRIFLEDMIVHHQGAVDMAKLLEAGTNRAEMKQFAADIIRVQSAEIDQMKAWQKAWFGN